MTIKKITVDTKKEADKTKSEYHTLGFRKTNEDFVDGKINLTFDDAPTTSPDLEEIKSLKQKLDDETITHAELRKYLKIKGV